MRPKEVQTLPEAAPAVSLHAWTSTPASANGRGKTWASSPRQRHCVAVGEDCTDRPQLPPGKSGDRGRSSAGRSAQPVRQPAERHAAFLASHPPGRPGLPQAGSPSGTGYLTFRLKIASSTQHTCFTPGRQQTLPARREAPGQRQPGPCSCPSSRLAPEQPQQSPGGPGEHCRTRTRSPGSERTRGLVEHRPPQNLSTPLDGGLGGVQREGTQEAHRSGPTGPRVRRPQERGSS